MTSAHTTATLRAVQAAYDVRGLAPTLSELASALGLASPSVVLRRVVLLEEAGLLSRAGNRTLRLTANGAALLARS